MQLTTQQINVLFLTILLLCFWFCPFSTPLCSLAAPGVFLICWLPFFVTHIMNTHCRTCYVPPGLYSAFTWLGYVNSALNPIIYTTFNIEFRRAFIKILSCWGRRSASGQLKWKLGCALEHGVYGKQWRQIYAGHGPQKQRCPRSYTAEAKWSIKNNTLWYAIKRLLFQNRLVFSTGLGLHLNHIIPHKTYIVHVYSLVDSTICPTLLWNIFYSMCAALWQRTFQSMYARKLFGAKMKLWCRFIDCSAVGHFVLRPAALCGLTDDSHLTLSPRIHYHHHRLHSSAFTHKM